MQPRPRVVSLLPSATEMLCAVGGRPLLVGRSHECDFPSGLDPLPILTSPRITTQDPAEIDRQVSQGLGDHGSLYTLDEPRIRDLRPDIILTQNLCEVCSIDLRTVERLAASLDPIPTIVSLNPDSVEAVLDDALNIGRAVGLETGALQAVVGWRERLFAAGEFVNPFDDGPSLAFLEWTDPMFCAGHWTVQLIERAGARHPLNPSKPKPAAGAATGPQQAERVAGKSYRITPRALAQTLPERIIIAPCGMNLEQTRKCAASLSRQLWWRDLPAVRHSISDAQIRRTPRIALVDGNQMFNRPGPRLVDAFEWLVGWLNERPELVPPGFPVEYPHLEPASGVLSIAPSSR